MGRLLHKSERQENQTLVFNKDFYKYQAKVILSFAELMKVTEDKESVMEMIKEFLADKQITLLEKD